MDTGTPTNISSIEIIYQTDDYCLVAQSAESNALRAGNEIVVTGKGLSDGQVVK